MSISNLDILDEINKVVGYWEAYKTNPSTAKLTIDGEVLKQAATELVNLRERLAYLEHENQNCRDVAANEYARAQRLQQDLDVLKEMEPKP